MTSQLLKQHHHGIALPLLSLHKHKDSPCGEFLDLIPLIEWCSSIGFDIIQLLPLNDSGYDTSPYSAHSAMALHPIYISLTALPHLELFDDLQTQSHLAGCTAQRVQYHAVLDAKLAFLRRYYEKACPLIASEPRYQAFASQKWVQEYALYKVLKGKNEQKPWWEWPEGSTASSDEMQFHIMGQFLAFDQLIKVKACANKKGIFLMGDIPILINRDSADVWQHPELFQLDFAAGAPPDMYSQEGQYWGFPLYNWQALEKEGFRWWKERLKIAQQFYHLYRLDHIVGFFRIWAIPLGKPAKEGFFLPTDPAAWIPQGEKILKELIQTSSMLPIGEDLGVVPQSVRDCMKRLNIAGTKVLRWEKHWDTDGSFIDPKTFEPLSMSTLSTHDSEGIAEWWAKFPLESSLWAGAHGLSDSQYLNSEQRLALLRECHESASLFHINPLQEYLGMFKELSWPHPEDDRINVPGVVADTNWTYRFRPSLDEIIQHKPLHKLMETFHGKIK